MIVPSITTNTARLKTRAMFRPKFPELPTQCASCPFRKGNDKEFGEVVGRLRTAERIPGPVKQKDIGFARLALLADLDKCGDFICHGTAYDRNMKLNPTHEYRQCPGATTIYRTGKLPQ